MKHLTAIHLIALAGCATAPPPETKIDSIKADLVVMERPRKVDAMHKLVKARACHPMKPCEEEFERLYADYRRALRNARYD